MSEIYGWPEQLNVSVRKPTLMWTNGKRRKNSTHLAFDKLAHLQVEACGCSSVVLCFFRCLRHTEKELWIFLAKSCPWSDYGWSCQSSETQMSESCGTENGSADRRDALCIRRVLVRWHATDMTCMIRGQEGGKVEKFSAFWYAARLVGSNNVFSVRCRQTRRRCIDDGTHDDGVRFPQSDRRFSNVSHARSLDSMKIYICNVSKSMARLQSWEFNSGAIEYVVDERVGWAAAREERGICDAKIQRKRHTKLL